MASMKAPLPPPYFKIVQTKDSSGADELSVVPSAWEKEGFLLWPPLEKISKTDILKMLKCADSVPQADWISYPAKVKRTGIDSYKSANKILTNMMDKSDSSSETDGNISHHPNHTRRRTHQKLHTNSDASTTNIISSLVSSVTKNKLLCIR